MAQAKTAVLRLESFAGGLNDTDPPHRIGDNQLSVANEAVLTPSGGIKRRGGTERYSVHPATLDFRLMHRHTPSALLSSTELWACPASASNFYRSTSGTTWASVSVSDAGSSTAPTDAASFNGKLYVAYEKNAGTNRLHCWDGTSIRPVGISTPSAPTVSNTGAGSYAATLRYYKAQFYRESPTGKYTFSDLSAAVSFTPSGTGTHARVTKPTTPDSATAWRVWGSADNVSYYLLTAQVVGTTTWDDNTAPASYSTVLPAYVPAESGEYTPPWSAKYLLVDENRLLIAGAFETSRYASRIGWSSIIGTAEAAYGDGVTVNDDERFPTDNYLDLDSDEGGEITGLEMLADDVFVFKRHAIYKLVRTGQVEVPYRPSVLSKVVGAISRKSIISAEDEAGNPALYFLSERGPYRLAAGGLQYLGSHIETTWATVNPSPTIPPHGVYDQRTRVVRWWVPVTSAYPDTQLIFHVRLGRVSANGLVTGGWTRSTAACYPNWVSCSALWPEDPADRNTPLAACGMHTNGQTGYPPVVWLFEAPGTLSDRVVHATTGAPEGTRSYTVSATTKTLGAGMGDKMGVRDVYMTCAPAATGVTPMFVTLSRDFGFETREKTVSVSTVSPFTGHVAHVIVKAPGLSVAEAGAVSVTIGSTADYGWTVTEVGLRASREEPR
jgi:hypothetical protein